MKKAAVVIGVNKTRDSALQELKSAAAGAREVAGWLESEGYAVECLTDEVGKVTASAVYEAIAMFAALPVKYDFLLVYFSGHGYWVSRADYWLLSGAPNNPNESINLRSSMELAKYSGIPNIVFISDACRSIPVNRSGQLQGGYDVFPNHPEINDASKIDFFKATSESLPAYEAKLAGTPRSVLTHALMSAFKKPVAGMVTELATDTGNIKVIPNRKLEGYLQHKVDDLLAEVSFTLSQRLEISVPSDDWTYIAQVHDTRNIDVIPIDDTTTEQQPQTRNLDEFNDFTVQQPPELFSVRDEDRPRIDAMIPDLQTDHFESETGFVVQGAAIHEAVCTKGKDSAWVEVLTQGDEHDASAQALVRVWGVAPAVSVLLELTDGRCVILACLHGYIGHAQFDADGLMNVSYLPASNNWRWGMVQGILSELNQLRAEAAQATEDNTLRLESPGAAHDLAQKIRVGKSVDPSLGLYAATAFAQASMEDKVRSVMDYMRSDLGADLFDVRLLASRTPEKIPGNAHYPLTPLCPMLTQNWHLLAIREVKLPAALEKARPYLQNSLWTTFAAGAGQDLIAAFKSGELE